MEPNGQQAARQIVILGAGHAGGAMAGLLREKDKACRITLVGDEKLGPYQRPPLSKAFLSGNLDAAGLALRAEAYYPAQAIELRLNVRAEAIDPAARRVRLSDGSVLDWTHLVIATGARARSLPVPGADLGGVISLRSMDDAARLKAVLRPGAHIAIIGGGYIGLEVAASARALGVAVTVIEREQRLLARVAGAALSEFFERIHRGHGVQFHFDASAQEILGENGRVRAVRLSEGTELACDAVLVGVGAVPNMELAQEAGIACSNGIIVDQAGRTDHAGIYAIGDVTWRPMPLYGHTARLESVPNTQEQARQVQADILGLPPPKPEVPWFWSDQYDLKLQIAGLAYQTDTIVMRGDPTIGKFAIFHGRQGRLAAVEAVNAASEFVIGRQLIGIGRTMDLGLLADTTVPMKQFLAMTDA